MFAQQLPQDLLYNIVFANEMGEAWDGQSIAEPELNGYEYKIDSASELAWFATEVNNKNTFYGKSIFITGNINLNQKEWFVIGKGTPGQPAEIKGNIVIKDAVITGLKATSNNASNNGLFGSVRVWDVEIDNLSMKDAVIGTTQSYDGIAFASLELARGGMCDVKNSTISGTIDGCSKCGALAGYVAGVNDNATINIENCNFKLVSTSYKVWWDGSKDNNGLKGGLIGRYYAPAKKNKLIINGVSCEDNLASFDEYGYGSCTAGGMIGEVDGLGIILIYQSTVSGYMISSGYCGFAGGIIGKMISCDKYRQSDSYVTITIDSYWNAYGYPYNAGGFIGSITNKKPDGYIRNSFYAGKSSTAVAFIAKDCCGGYSNLKVFDCYYDSSLSQNAVFHSDYHCYVLSSAVSNCKMYSTSSMRIQSNFNGWDFNNTWIMGKDHPELLRTNFAFPSDFFDGLDSMMEDSEIVKIVREYTSADFYAQWEKIWSGDYSDDVKIEKILALASYNGITDPREGLEFVSKSKNKRNAYRLLTTDELYMASNFLNWLDEDGNFERFLLAADGLIFNRELDQWLDPGTYIESDYPGIAKYKDMLYSYMDSTSRSLEAWNDVKLVSKLSENVTEANKKWVEEKIKYLNTLDGPNSFEQRKLVIKEMEERGVFFDTDIEDQGNLNVKRSYELDETSGFGKFTKAMGLATKTIKLVDMTITDIQDFVLLDSKLQTYYQYKNFLQDIISAPQGDIPFELHEAACQVLKEIEGGYGTELLKIAWQVIDQTEITSEVKKTVLASLGATSFLSLLKIINIEAWFINQVVDIGNMVKKEAYVEGYAYLSRFYKKKLEQSCNAFLNNMSDVNAWNFYYNYNMLYSLRCEGENAYLQMCNLKGLCGKMLSLGYAAKEDAVNETLAILNEKCRFDLGEDAEIPESLKYLSKLVVSCPVDVTVYTAEGDIIAQLKDGELEDISNEYGRFAVVYNSYTSDYEKVICLLNENVKIDITANEDGLVNIQYSYLANEDQVKILQIPNLPVSTKNVIKLDPDDIEENNKVTIIETIGNKNIEFTEVNDSYVQLTAASLSERDLHLHVGENKLLSVKIEPNNASVQNIDWRSSDPTIVTVKNGNVSGIKAGKAIVYGFVKGSDIIINCNVAVTSQGSSETCTPIPTGGYQQGDSSNLEISNKDENTTSEEIITSPEEDKDENLTIMFPTRKIAAGKKLILTSLIGSDPFLGESVIWKSSNTKYATVNQKGVVTTKKAGAGKTVTITATSKDGKDAKVSIKICIMKNAVTQVRVIKPPKFLKVGKSVTLKAQVTATGRNANKKLKWMSSNSKYASVNSKGKVVAKKAGKAKTVTITAISTDGTNRMVKVKITIK